MGTRFDTSWVPDLANSVAPKYRTLSVAIEDAIRSGALASGAKLPPVRELAWEIGVTPGTVARAYREATEAGALRATVGQGTFVRDRRETGTFIPLHPLTNQTLEGQIDLRNSRSPMVGQEHLINEAIKRVMQRGSVVLDDYTRATNDLSTRKALAGWLAEGGVVADKDAIVPTYGAQQAVLVAMMAVTSGPHPVILVSDLIYPGFQQAAKLAGVTLYPIQSDEHGLQIDALTEACRTARPQAMLVTPNLHNPTLVTMPENRRIQIAELARAHDVQIIEDDVYGWLMESRPPSFPALAPERTWYATSLSKCVAAGLRFGCLVTPPGRGAIGQGIIQAMNYRVSSLIGQTVAELIESGTADEIRINARKHLEERAALLRSYLAPWGVHTAIGANFAWLPLPEGWHLAAFDRACAEAGVRIATAGAYVLPGADVPNKIRIALGMGLSDETFADCLSRISRILAHPPVELMA
ncbi:PLP-dependent aminotransferase family protein [Pontivivens nitratireducens]|uniref:aminotransferase-like domain-containing protein n=1 Tax=Pontivivens nitratireducens TaxID=2758038 RepID=UPI0016398861|nr:PLP-dependent aminotransferase family protein [Pontibrevibacter nitratireducens]